MADTRRTQRFSENATAQLDEEPSRLSIRKYGRYWALYDAQGTLIAVTVYKRGALEVVRRIVTLEESEIEHRSGMTH